MSRTATCRCQVCAIEVEGDPMVNQLCHCASCKRRTGGPCGWSAIFRTDQVRGQRGEFRIYTSDGTAGRVENSFCAACGTTLFFVPADFPGLVGVAGGCFADQPLGEPTISASDDLRCAWLGLPESWTVRTSAMAQTSQPKRG